jgi:hypothetical protein
MVSKADSVERKKHPDLRVVTNSVVKNISASTAANTQFTSALNHALSQKKMTKQNQVKDFSAIDQSKAIIKRAVQSAVKPQKPKP